MQVILFGAGKGSEEFLQFNKASELHLDVKAIIDNDPSLHGGTLATIPVVPLSQLSLLQYDLVLVTSVSGKEAISTQLEQLNLIEGKDFLCIGKYPSNYRKQCNILFQHVQPDELVGKRCLHVGPGGFLGLEMLLYTMGADQVVSIDKFGFGMEYPDVSARAGEYRQVWPAFRGLSMENVDLSDRKKRFDSLFQDKAGRLFLDEKKISYKCRIDVESLPFEDQKFDYIFSFAVLEHVRNPQRAVQEMTRVTRQGGRQFHTITTRDHRSYSAVGNFHPFSYREVSAEEWEMLVRDKFYQNRILPVQWRKIFEGSGMGVLHFEADSRFDIESYQQDFHQDFLRFTREELEEVDCSLLATKGE